MSFQASTGDLGMYPPCIPFFKKTSPNRNLTALVLFQTKLVIAAIHMAITLGSSVTLVSVQ